MPLQKIHRNQNNLFCIRQKIFLQKVLSVLSSKDMPQFQRQSLCLYILFLLLYNRIDNCVIMPHCARYVR